MPNLSFLNVANMSFNTIHEDKTIAKFTKMKLIITLILLNVDLSI